MFPVNNWVPAIFALTCITPSSFYAEHTVLSLEIKFIRVI